MNNPPSDQGIPILTEVIAPDMADKGALAGRSDPLPPMRASIPSPSVTSPPVGASMPGASIAPARTTQPLSTTTPAVQATRVQPAPLPVVPASVPAPLAPPVQPALSDAPAQGGATAEDWKILENDLRQTITRQVLGRIDFVLDHRVRNSLTDVVDAAIDGLAAEIKRGLHATLEEMVARAVAQELARLNTLKK